MCMRFGNSQLPWREGLRKECSFACGLLPLTCKTSRQSAFQTFQRRNCPNPAVSRPGVRSPGCTHQEEERGPRKPDTRANAPMAHFGACQAPRAVIDFVASSRAPTLLPTARDGLRPGAEWNSAPRKSMKIDRPDPTGIFISIALAWFLQDADSDADADAAARPPLRADGKRRAQVRDSRGTHPDGVQETEA
jgi:hypothetical protein